METENCKLFEVRDHKNLIKRNKNIIFLSSKDYNNNNKEEGGSKSCFISWNSCCIVTEQYFGNVYLKEVINLVLVFAVDLGNVCFSSFSKLEKHSYITLLYTDTNNT